MHTEAEAAPVKEATPPKIALHQKNALIRPAVGGKMDTAAITRASWLT